MRAHSITGAGAGRRGGLRSAAMLCLAAPTSADWTARALAQLDEVLVDHAHCERKAAGMAVQLLFRYPEHAFLQEPLSRLAREELAHFEEVLRILAARGIPLRRQKPAAYAGRLRSEIRSGGSGQLVDTLLCSALIEARSCERFRLLAEAVDDAELAAFYRGLLAAEARHHRVYVELALQLAPEAPVRERLAALSAWEARAIAEGPPRARMHG
jgi:tRNA-(ms[2]io[6]A)-hydroxylase